MDDYLSNIVWWIWTLDHADNEPDPNHGVPLELTHDVAQWTETHRNDQKKLPVLRVIHAGLEVGAGESAPARMATTAVRALSSSLYDSSRRALQSDQEFLHRLRKSPEAEFAPCFYKLFHEPLWSEPPGDPLDGWRASWEGLAKGEGGDAMQVIHRYDQACNGVIDWKEMQERVLGKVIVSGFEAKWSRIDRLKAIYVLAEKYPDRYLNLIEEPDLKLAAKILAEAELTQVELERAQVAPLWLRWAAEKVV